MRTNFKKKLICTLVLVLFASILMPLCTVSGEMPTNYVEWTVSSDLKTMTDGENTYYRYYPKKNFDLELDEIFRYRYPAFVERDDLKTLGMVYSYEDGGDIIWINSDAEYVYVTKNGKNILDAFFDGNIDNYALTSTSIDSGARYISYVDKELLDVLNADAEHATGKLSVEVVDLRFAECYVIIGCDETGSFSNELGAVYFVDGKYCYLNYQTLGNQYFDADGNFSYRSGSVELSPLEPSSVVKFKNAIDGLNIRPDYKNIIEEDREMTSGGIVYVSMTSTMVAFWVMFSIIGYIVPAVLGVVSILLARSKNKGKPKYWYINAVIAGVWIVLAVILMIVLLL